MADPRVRMYTGLACAFCVRAKRLLDARNVAFEEILIDRFDQGELQRLVDLTGRYTVPQILIDDEPIGGFEELSAWDRSGRLAEVLG